MFTTFCSKFHFTKIHSARTQSEAAEGSRSPLVWIMSTNAADSMLAMKCRLQCCANIKSSPSTWLCCCLGQDRRPRSFLGTNEVLLDQVLFIGKLDKIWWSQYFLCFDMTGGRWSIYISNFSFQKHFVHLWFWPLEFHTGQWRHDLPLFELNHCSLASKMIILQWCWFSTFWGTIYRYRNKSDKSELDTWG